MKRISHYGPYDYDRRKGTMLAEPFFALGTWYAAILLDGETIPLVVKLNEVKVTQA